MAARPKNSLPAEFAELNPDAWTEPFWLATREHRLEIPRCVKCGLFRFPPSPFCFNCTHQEVEMVQVSGAGSVYTFTVARHAVVPMLAPYVPYVVAVVELDDAPGVRMIVNIVESDPEAVEIGSKVSLVWDDVDEETTIPRFTLSA
ncbi:Zn-ribbon domain-containing OB-fold protein [Jatrophihabitans sp. DSM 45814]